MKGRCRLSWIPQYWGILALVVNANLCDGAESAVKPLRGGIYAYVLSATYLPDDGLNAKFENAGDAFAAHLQTVIPEKDRIVHLKGPQVTKKALEDILKTIGGIQNNALVIFYYCGHGFKEGSKPVEAAPDAPDTRATCLALFGCDRSGKVSNANDLSLSISRVVETFDRRPNLNFMVFLDCCFSGAQVPLLPSSGTGSYSAGNRGIFLASSTADELSYNCSFTDAVLKVWSGSGFGKSETPVSLEAKVSDEMRKINGGEGKQFAQHIVGNDGLPLGVLSSDTCIVSLQLSPLPAPPQYLVSIEGEAPIQKSPGTSMLLMTVPRKNCVVTISGPYFKTCSERVDFTGRLYYPLQIRLNQSAGNQRPTLAEQQIEIEADYRNFLAQAGELGVSVASVGIEAIRNARLSQPLLNPMPLVRTFVASVADSGDQALAQTELVKAAGYLVRNESLPVTAEGRRLASLLSTAGIGGEGLVSAFNYKCVDSITNDPEQAARDLGFQSADAAKDHLVAFFSTGLRNAASAGDKTLIYTEPQRLLAKFQTSPRVLRKSDYEQLRTLQLVAAKTYQARAVLDQPADEPIDLRIVKRAADYQTVIKNTDVFRDSTRSSRDTSSEVSKLVRSIDRSLTRSSGVLNAKEPDIRFESTSGFR